MNEKYIRQYVEHTEGDGVEMFKAVCKLGLEGIVSKKLNAPYKSGPSKAWLKIKNPTFCLAAVGATSVHAFLIVRLHFKELLSCAVKGGRLGTAAKQQRDEHKRPSPHPFALTYDED